jgi:hypothetical protein
MRFAVEQIRQRPLAQRPGDEIGNTPLGIGDAARPPERVARASLSEAPARVAREARRDQYQGVEIFGFHLWKAGGSRTEQVNRQQFPASATLHGRGFGEGGNCMFSIRSRQGPTLAMPTRIRLKESARAAVRQNIA